MLNDKETIFELRKEIKELKRLNGNLKNSKSHLKSYIKKLKQEISDLSFTVKETTKKYGKTLEKQRKALVFLNEIFDFSVDLETGTLECSLGKITANDDEFLEELKNLSETAWL